MKILVLGLNPSVLGGKSPTIKNLNKWLDILELKYVSFSNIYAGTGVFKDKQIERTYLNEICPQYDKILALGKEVGNVLDLIGVHHFKLPHPSGRNRQLNNKRFLKERLDLCSKYIQGEH